MHADICFATAVNLARLLRRRAVSAVDVMRAFLERIDRVNPKVNAICTLVEPDRLLLAAREADEQLARGEDVGPLHGFPLAVKDLSWTKGIRTTFGSPIHEHFIPAEDALFVERLKRAGAIVIGKTNTPEFGAGSQTFNRLFGATRNPYDLSKTCGGSSGGAAVAVACGMLPLADGSDLGASLRNPAGFCNVVGFRPSLGRVASRPRSGRQGAPIHNTLSTEGPIARSVEDAALLLSVMAGPDARVPAAIDEPGSIFLGSLAREFRGTRIAWSRNLGHYPVQPIVNQVCDVARPAFAALGCDVDDVEPDFRDADEIFQVLRAKYLASILESDFTRHRDLMKETLVWNIERGLALTDDDVARAEEGRVRLRQRTDAFLETYEFVVAPVSQVVPFDVETEWVREINGVPMRTYIDWIGTCYAITLTGLPAISVPCGFTPEGLPVGLQIVGRPRADRSVLELAHAFEQATGYGKEKPTI
jgi:amidase